MRVSATLFALALASPVAAQVTVGQTFALTMHSVPNVACLTGDLVEQWAMTYGPAPCFVPEGIASGSAFIVGIRVRITPADTTQAPRVVTVPRSSVYRTATEAGCAPTPAPCLSVRVASVPGPFLVDVAFLDGQGFSSAWSEALPALGPTVPTPPPTGIQAPRAWRLRP